MSWAAHPWLCGLLGDAETSAPLAPAAQLAGMLQVEAAFARALGNAGQVERGLAEATAEAILNAGIRPEDLCVGTERDGVPVPDLIARLKQALPPECHVALHKGLTSQDVLDTALALGLRQVNDVLANRILGLQRALEALKRREGARVLMGRTRMQAALPITAGDRIDTWLLPLERHLSRLDRVRAGVEVLSFGGAVGARTVAALPVAQAMADAMGLLLPTKAPHAMRDGLADYAGWLSLVTGGLGKMGQDVALMAQQGIDDVALAGGGGSSAMPHKQNPVAAETLVALARFNAVLLGGMHQALVHEQERSGAAWTLEWMVLPQMVETAGRALLTAQALAGAITRIGTA